MRSKRIDEAYLEFLRKKNCVFCGGYPVDPHHVIARGWREPFRDDYLAFPACRKCHAASHRLPLSDVLARHGLTEKEFVVATVDLLVEYFLSRRNENGSVERRNRRLIKAAVKKSVTVLPASAPERSDAEVGR